MALVACSANPWHARAVVETLRFPPGFLWGTATSSHQVEGGNSNNDWWQWERKPGVIRDGQRSEDAAGWWNGRAEEDLSTAAELGQNAHRLSLEWSRLEPAPGHWDEAAFDRYARMLDHAKDLGLTLMVTLNHFTLPRWASETQGWLDRELPTRFAEFARQCARRLRHVDMWATLNEPNVLGLLGYALERWPPGVGHLRSYGAAVTNMLRAHTQAARIIRHVAPRSKVGLVLNLPYFEPARNRPSDMVLAATQDRWMNACMLRALETGTFAPPFSIRRRRIPDLERSFDWLGLNYYGRYQVRFDPFAPSTGFSRFVQSTTSATAWTDWGQPFAEGLTRQLQRMRHLRVPLYVTENGIFDNDDRLRPQFIREHVRAVHDAVRDGVDVRGYFHWSLVDNFEWAEGWSTHFGLLALDRKTGVRRRRESANVYAEICRANALV